MLIVRVFNERFVLVVPISSKVKIGRYYYPFVNPSGEKNVVALSHLKSMSAKRLIRNVGEMGQEDFSKVKALLRDML